MIKKILFKITLIISVILATYGITLGYTIYYDCGTCATLTSASNTSGLQTLGSNSGWSYVNFGSSVQSRAVDGVIVHTSGYDQTVMIVGGVHGDDETTTTRAVYDFANYLSANPTIYPKIRFILIPMVNPDGRALVTRRNAGLDGYPVNINRNFAEGWGAAVGCTASANAGSASTASNEYKGPSANSEPETQIIREAVDTYNPDVYNDWHMNANCMIWTDNSEGETSTNASWRLTQVNADLVSNGFSALNDLACHKMGVSPDYAGSLGKESYTIEGGYGAVKLEVNRVIGTMVSYLNHRRYFNSGAIRMTSSASSIIGNVTYSGGILSSIGLTNTAESQSLEIKGYKSPFVEATKTTIDLANNISTPAFGQSTTTLTGVPLTIAAVSGSLDVVVNSWASNSKSWTESTSSAPTNPVHVIGGLTVGQSYRVAVSDAAQSTITGADCTITGGYNWCIADASGNVTFTYEGTYSDHTFTLDQYNGGSSLTGIITGGYIK